MIEKKQFFFLRHAETDWNCKKLCQGQTDVPLSEEGIFSAKAFALKTKTVNISSIISSPLKRALQTAKEIHLFHKKASFHIISELAERGWGEVEGMSNQTMYELEALEIKNPSSVLVQGGETKPLFRERVLEGIVKAQKISPCPFIVSHGRVFLEICQILGISSMKELANCELAEFVPGDLGWLVNTPKIIQE